MFIHGDQDLDSQLDEAQALLPSNGFIYINSACPRDDLFKIIQERNLIIEEHLEGRNESFTFARKPIDFEMFGLKIKEASNDQEMRDFYSITKGYALANAKEIDISYDRVSYHFIAYKDGEPIAVVRNILNKRIELPFENGNIFDSPTIAEGGHFTIPRSEVSSEISQLIRKKNISAKLGGLSLVALIRGVTISGLTQQGVHSYVTNEIEDINHQRFLQDKMQFESMPGYMTYTGFEDRHYLMFRLSAAKFIKAGTERDNWISKIVQYP